MVQIGQGVDVTGIDQLVDQFVAQTVHIHGAAVCKMPDRLLALGAAKKPTRAAVVCFTLFPLGQTPAHRAVGHHGELR